MSDDILLPLVCQKKKKWKTMVMMSDGWWEGFGLSWCASIFQMRSSQIKNAKHGKAWQGGFCGQGATRMPGSRDC